MKSSPAVSCSGNSSPAVSCSGNSGELSYAKSHRPSPGYRSLIEEDLECSLTSRASGRSRELLIQKLKNVESSFKTWQLEEWYRRRKRNGSVSSSQLGSEEDFSIESSFVAPESTSTFGTVLEDSEFKRPFPKKRKLVHNSQYSSLQTSISSIRGSIPSMTYDLWTVKLHLVRHLCIEGSIFGSSAIVLSKPVVRRVNNWRVESEDAVLKLVHPPNTSGLPVYVATQFQNGFPGEWDHIRRSWITYVEQGEPAGFDWSVKATTSNLPLEPDGQPQFQSVAYSPVQSEEDFQAGYNVTCQHKVQCKGQCNSSINSSREGQINTVVPEKEPSTPIRSVQPSRRSITFPSTSPIPLSTKPTNSFSNRTTSVQRVVSNVCIGNENENQGSSTVMTKEKQNQDIIKNISQLKTSPISEPELLPLPQINANELSTRTSSLRSLKQNRSSFLKEVKNNLNRNSLLHNSSTPFHQNKPTAPVASRETVPNRIDPSSEEGAHDQEDLINVSAVISECDFHSPRKNRSSVTKDKLISRSVNAGTSADACVVNVKENQDLAASVAANKQIIQSQPRQPHILEPAKALPKDHGVRNDGNQCHKTNESPSSQNKILYLKQSTNNNNQNDLSSLQTMSSKKQQLWPKVCLKRLSVKKENVIQEDDDDSSIMQLKQWTPSLVQTKPLKLVLVGSLYRSTGALVELYHRTAAVEEVLHSNMIVTSDTSVYAVIGPMADPDKNIPTIVVSSMSKGIPNEWQEMLVIWDKILKKAGPSCKPVACIEPQLPHHCWDFKEKKNESSKVNMSKTEKYERLSNFHGSELEPLGARGILPTSRSGRTLLPPLRYWIGERTKKSRVSSVYIQGKEDKKISRPSTLAHSLNQKKRNSEPIKKRTNMVLRRKMNGKEHELDKLSSKAGGSKRRMECVLPIDSDSESEPTMQKTSTGGSTNSVVDLCCESDSEPEPVKKTKAPSVVKVQDHARRMTHDVLKQKSNKMDNEFDWLSTKTGGNKNSLESELSSESDFEPEPVKQTKAQSVVKASDHTRKKPNFVLRNRTSKMDHELSKLPLKTVDNKRDMESDLSSLSDSEPEPVMKTIASSVVEVHDRARKKRNVLRKRSSKKDHEFDKLHLKTVDKRNMESDLSNRSDSEPEPVKKTKAPSVVKVHDHAKKETNVVLRDRSNKKDHECDRLSLKAGDHKQRTVSNVSRGDIVKRNPSGEKPNITDHRGEVNKRKRQLTKLIFHHSPKADDNKECAEFKRPNSVIPVRHNGLLQDTASLPTVQRSSKENKTEAVKNQPLKKRTGNTRPTTVSQSKKQHVASSPFKVELPRGRPKTLKERKELHKELSKFRSSGSTFERDDLFSDPDYQHLECMPSNTLTKTLDWRELAQKQHSNSDKIPLMTGQATPPSKYMMETYKGNLTITPTQSPVLEMPKKNEKDVIAHIHRVNKTAPRKKPSQPQTSHPDPAIHTQTPNLQVAAVIEALMKGKSMTGTIIDPHFKVASESSDTSFNDTFDSRY